MSEAPIIGIVSPPEWYEPSVDESRILCDEPVRMQQAIVARPDLVYDDLEQIAGALPDRGNGPIRSGDYPLCTPNSRYGFGRNHDVSRTVALCLWCSKCIPLLES